MTLRLGFALMLLFAVICPSVHASDCGRAKRIYESALEHHGEQKMQLLQEANSLCPDQYGAHYELGLMLFDRGRYSEAAEQFEAALVNSKQRASAARLYEEQHDALVGMARSVKMLGRKHQALALFRMAFDLRSDVALQAEIVELEKQCIGSVADAGEIADALKSAKTLKRSSKAGLSPEPSLNIRVHFDYDSSDLNSEGRRQADELGKALSDQSFARDSFQLIGHTDIRGDAEYNRKLSQRRARTVADHVSNNFHIPQNRIQAAGKGKSEPLVAKDEAHCSEADHAVNRRVEVKLIMGVN